MLAKTRTNLALVLGLLWLEPGELRAQQAAEPAPPAAGAQQGELPEVQVIQKKAPAHRGQEVGSCRQEDRSATGRRTRSGSGRRRRAGPRREQPHLWRSTERRCRGACRERTVVADQPNQHSSGQSRRLPFGGDAGRRRSRSTRSNRGRRTRSSTRCPGCTSSTMMVSRATAASAFAARRPGAAARCSRSRTASRST